VFALELYRKLASTPGNLFYSPYSVESALAMVSEATAGTTHDELVRVMGERAGRHPTLAAKRSVDGVVLATANALWHQTGYPIVPAYLELVRDQLRAEVHPVDFAADPEAAVAAINRWVAAATSDRIPVIVSSVPPKTRVIVANAMYFKARWEAPFPTATPQPFTTGGGERVDVPTMRQTHGYRYAKLSAIEAIELTYIGRQIAMVIVVPPPGAALADLERVLDLDRIVSALAPEIVDLALPKFRIESGFALRDVLEEIGVVEMFSRHGDFSRMTSERGFGVDEVVHKTYVEVDERGTKAAAATATMMLGSVRQPPPPIKLHIDRPFIFAIRDRLTATNLFIGRVEDPR